MGAITGLVVPRFARTAAAVLACIVALPTTVSAIEFMDGRIQIHGFGEVQVRALNEKFSEELDLAQWYNVLNVEFEFDIAPDGFGPFDLISAYSRVEVRYDTLYDDGLGMFRSADTYGGGARRLPERLSDAVDREFAGTNRATDRDGDFAAPRHFGRNIASLIPVGERFGFPGYDTFFRQFGPDDLPGVNPNANRGVLQIPGGTDDPAYYVHERLLGYQFGLKETRGTANTGTQILGPWLPKNFVRALALNKDRANAFRGRVAPTKPRVGTFQGVPGVGLALVFADQPDSIRHFRGDPSISDFFAANPGDTELLIDNLDPLIDGLLNAPDTAIAGFIDPDGNFTPLGGNPSLNEFFPTNFGGDFARGIAACVDPASTDAEQIRLGGDNPPGARDCIRGSFDVGPDDMFGTADDVGIYTDPQILGVSRIIGGGGENPFRPAPDVGNLGRVAIDPTETVTGNPDSTAGGSTTPQGGYIPSLATARIIKSGTLDKENVNFRENERKWNRGDAQQRTKELKEAYLDVELLDSRLWLRLGLQNIVWGKTELFRTTDQFNPQDLALASLPSLEESRIALWSARAVYSLYDVGPLEDVRLEFAANLDQYQNADIGACGEPYTPDLVCGLTTGLFAHGLLGIGVVGIDRPESPWKEPSDLEFGGRIEWRWDRFSFALTDFYGFSDFPFADAVFFYERSVDPMTGRPLIARLPGQSLGTCASAGQISPIFVSTNYPGAVQTDYSTSYASHPASVTTGVIVDNPMVGGQTRGGIGTDPGCLRPGGPSGGLVSRTLNGLTTDQPRNQNALYNFDDGIDDDIDNTNALEYHHANQQIFSWICAGTVGIAAVLDASACAWTIFSTPELLLPQLLRVPFSELIAITMSGTQSGAGAINVLNAVGGNQKFDEADFTSPLVSLNALFNDPAAPLYDRNVDGGIGIGPDDADDCNPPAGLSPEERAARLARCDLIGFDGFDGRVSLDPRAERADGRQIVFQTLDNSLTNEQRALLGCGPFWGTRCDSSSNTNEILEAGPGTPQIDPVPKYFARAGGLDFLNMEASALVQAWPGFEGTTDGHLTWAGLPTNPNTRDPDPRQQPGTVLPGGAAANTLFGPVCTRFVSSINDGVKLPGCRGIASLDVITDNAGDPVRVEVVFEEGYLPSVDGCVIGDRVVRTGGGVVDVVAVGAGPDLAAEFPLCSRAERERLVPGFLLTGYTGGANPEPILVANPACTGVKDGAFFGAGDAGTPALGTPGVSVSGELDFEVCESDIVTLDMLPMIHPVSGCIDSEVWFEARANTANAPADSAITGLTQLGGCEYFYQRDLVEEFFEGNAALFQNELAAFSWNFMLFLATSSCNESSKDLDGRDHAQPTPGNAGPGRLPFGAIGGLREDPQCFDAERPWTPGRCSFAAPQLCGNVKGFLGAAGLRRNVVRAGGNDTHGRRTFIWHGGGELVLAYEKRNVLGFSTDFAEDVTQTSWGVEFTWIEDVPFTDNSSFNGITRSDSYNLTVSVDRPTFINFLNPNRTFFFNSQWFFNYRPDYNKGFTSNGPVNVLFTFAMFTGYFQDRVLPRLVTVYDFNSRSGGILPEMQYRFTEAFSATIGMLYFFGRTQLTDMGINEFGPPANRAGEKTYETGVDNTLSLIRKRDEVFLRLRWTF